ncbi:MAG: hypothetical protein DRQ99_31010, partial [Candidatus Parabeggiatoa sp. nov. 3]
MIQGGQDFVKSCSKRLPRKENNMNTKTELVRFDWAMKSLLRDKANFDILEGFLSAVLRQDVTVI